MDKRILIVLCILFSALVNAQENTKYLQGAVPEVEGKVVFRKTINTDKQVSEDKLFEWMNKWVQENYDGKKDTKNKVLLSNVEDKSIACAGKKVLSFKKSTFVLDQAFMIYQLILDVTDSKCDVTVRNIKYEYSDYKQLVPAEEMITDKIALSGKKLNRHYDKFRIHTVDSVNSIFNSIDIYLNGAKTVGVVGLTQSESSQPAVSAGVLPSVMTTQSVAGNMPSSLPGYKQITPDRIPGNIVKLLSEWMLITSGKPEKLNVMTASWGGLGVLWEKPIATCFLNPTRYSVTTMDEGDTYTLSFYTEAYKEALTYCGSNSGRNTDKVKGSGLTPIKTPSGATAFSEAWMILECRKIVAQQLSPEAIIDKSLPANWSKDGYHKMYIGEILNVWIK